MVDGIPPIEFVDAIFDRQSSFLLTPLVLGN